MPEYNLITFDNSVVGQQLPMGVSGQLPVQGLVQKIAIGGGGGALSIPFGTIVTENGVSNVSGPYPMRGVQVGDVAHIGGRLSLSIDPASSPGAPRWVTFEVPGVNAGGTSFGVCTWATGTGGAFAGYCVCIYDAIQLVLLDPSSVVPSGFADVYFEATYTALVL